MQPKINGSALGVIADPGEIGTASAGTAFLGLCEYENLLTKTIILNTAREHSNPKHAIMQAKVEGAALNGTC